MEILSSFKNLIQGTTPQFEEKGTTQRKLSYAEKERILARRVTTQDMVQFSGMPYCLNRPVRLFDEPHGHAYAYISLTGPNISAAIVELERMNARLRTDSRVSPKIPSSLQIPVRDIVFTPSKERGCTKLLCSPYTFEGKVAEIPLSLVFMTNLDGEKDSTHGTLHYAPDGHVAKATIYFWRNRSGYFFYYETLNQSFVLSKVELSTVTVSSYSPEIIYKDPYWIKMEQARKQETADFKWLQSVMPEQCPKSISGFRRMKHANTKNFQALAAEAKRRGRNIE